MTKKLAMSLRKEVLPINRKVSRLNFGGCGVFAVHFARMLQDIGFKDVVITSMEVDSIDSYRNYHPTNLECLREVMKGNGSARNIETYYHYMVRVGKWYFDSETATKQIGDEGVDVMVDGDEDFYFPIGDYNIEDIAFANKFQFLWNDEYDRGQNVIVKNFIKKVKTKFI